MINETVIIGELEKDEVLHKNSKIEIYTGAFKNLKDIIIKKYPNAHQDLYEKEIAFLNSYRSSYFPICKSFLKSKSSIYLIFEYCQGRDINSYLRNFNFIPTEIAKKLFRTLIESLKFLQKNSLVHTKLNSTKVLLTKENLNEATIMLTGFSHIIELSQVENQIKKEFESIYQAPELFKGKSFDYQQNIWNLGIIAYEMLYGVLPSQPKTIQEYQQFIENEILFELNENVNQEGIDFLNSMLRVNPDERLDFDELLQSNFLRLNKNYENKEEYKSASSTQLKVSELENLNKNWILESKALNFVEKSSSQLENSELPQAKINQNKADIPAEIDELIRELEKIKTSLSNLNFFNEEHEMIKIIIIYSIRPKIESIETLIQSRYQSNTPSFLSSLISEIKTQISAYTQYFHKDINSYCENFEQALETLLEALLESYEININTHPILCLPIASALEQFPSNKKILFLDSILKSFP